MAFDIKQLCGLEHLQFAVIESKGGYTFQFDIANEKIKVFKQAPPIVYDEHHVADSTTKQITTNYPAAFIINVATPSQNLMLRSTGVTPSANECALTAQMAAATRTTIATEPAYDELLGKGTFTGAADGWTLTSGWTYATNTMTKDGAGTGALTADAGVFTPVVGRTYRLTYTVSTWTAGTSLTVTCGGATVATITGTATATEAVFTATSTAALVFTPTTDVRCVMDSVYVYCEDVYVTYVTQAWKEIWDNLVQDESVTLSSSAATDSAYPVLALMYVDRTSATAKALKIMDEDDTVASGAIPVYFGKVDGTGTFKTAHADENAKVCKVTYIKKPTSGFLHERAFANEGATLTSYGINTFDYPILLWGYSGLAPVNGGNTQRLLPYASYPGASGGGTATNQAVVLDYFGRGQRASGAPANGTTLMVPGVLAFTTGATALLQVGEVITDSGGKVATITGITFTSGVIASSNVAGTLSVRSQDAAFSSGAITGGTSSGTAAVAGDFAYVTATGAGVWGSPSEITNLQPLEVLNGEDLSALSSVKLLLIGD
jgi:hypothetical protein